MRTRNVRKANLKWCEDSTYQVVTKRERRRQDSDIQSAISFITIYPEVWIMAGSHAFWDNIIDGAAMDNRGSRQGKKRRTKNGQSSGHCKENAAVAALHRHFANNGVVLTPFEVYI